MTERLGIKPCSTDVSERFQEVMLLNRCLANRRTKVAIKGVGRLRPQVAE